MNEKNKRYAARAGRDARAAALLSRLPASAYHRAVGLRRVGEDEAPVDGVERADERGRQARAGAAAGGGRRDGRGGGGGAERVGEAALLLDLEGAEGEEVALRRLRHGGRAPSRCTRRKLGLKKDRFG